jgi:4-hydroxy-tetrahydrodipicolinate synthase
MSEPGLSGIHAMVYAFFDARGRLDRDAMRRQVEASIAAGANGVTALGLATEVAKLSADERLEIMDWTATDVAGRVPLGFTIFGPTVEAQIAEAERARAAGADWVIHQPPPKATIQSEAELVDFFAAAMAGHSLTAAIQNAPAYLGLGLSRENLVSLKRRAPNFRVLKGEGPAVEIAETIAALGDDFPVFNGRGGLECLDNLRAGCAGLIVAPDVIDCLVAAYDRQRAGREDDAERAYRQALPAIVFAMQSIDTLIAYGKRIAAWRMGFEVLHDRTPALAPTAFGLAVARRLAADLGAMKRARPGAT